MKLNRNKMAMLMIAIMVTSVVMMVASADVTVLDAPPQQPVQVKGDVTYQNGSRVPNGWLVTLTDVTNGTELGNDTTEYCDIPSIPQYAVKVDPSLIVVGNDIKTSVSNGSWDGSVTYTVKSGDNAVGHTIMMAGIVVTGEEPGNLTTIDVTPSTPIVNVNATEQFTATAKDQDGNVMPDVVITWTSSNETVGTITDAGLLTALAVGATTVTATNETVNDTADVTVELVPPQNLTVTNLEADPNTGVNKDNPTTVSATITSSAELELIALYAIDTKKYQPKQYALYVEDIPVSGDDYSADWDATVFEVKNETTSSGKPVFVGKTDRWDTTTYYSVSGNLTINVTSGTAFAVALFNTGDLKLSKIIDPVTKESHSVESGTTTFAPFAMDATDRDSITDLWVLLGNLEPLDAVTLTGAAPDYNISLVKEQVPNEYYVVGLAALDKAGDRDYNETTVSVSTAEDYAVSISTDDAGKTVAPNVKATYTLTVENEGTKTDNYTLSFTREDADHADLNIVNITNLKEGETKDVSLNVSDESVGTYTVNVTVKSLTEPSVTDMVSTLTTVKTTPTPTPPPRRRGGGGGSGGVSDSDGDGYSDIEEIIVGTDPYDPCDPNPACLACIGEAIIAEVITTPEPTPYDPTKGITPPTTKPVATVPPPEKEPTPTPKPPGFEAVFAIAGLLAVAYLVQRRKK